MLKSGSKIENEKNIEKKSFIRLTILCTFYYTILPKKN